MSIRSSHHIFKLIVFAPLLLAACAAPPREVTPGQSSESSQMTAATPAAPSVAVGHDSSDSAAAAPVAAAQPAGSAQGSGGVKWSMPSRWQTGPEKPMRAATYLIPAAPGDSEGGECAVFMNIGGGVDANIKRWIGQFQQSDGSSSTSKAKQNKETVNGFQVTTVDLTGVFNGGMAMMGQAPAQKTNYRLLGAIVETPQGEVFFKLTGPEKTISAAQADFTALIKSIKN